MDMKTFEQYSTASETRLDEMLEPMSIALTVFLGTMFLRSEVFTRLVDKLEHVVNHLERNHFLKHCLEKLKTAPRNPSLEDVKAALGPDFDRFKKEFTDQVHNA